MLALRQLSPDQWISDLSAYANLAHDQLSLTDEAVSAQFAAWMHEIDQVFETIPPRDVTLNISWLLLLLAQREINQSNSLDTPVSIVQSWLASSDPHQQVMGRACTKQLFNFYGVESSQPTVVIHSALLRLLKSFMVLKPEAAEFSGIFRMMLRWAEQPEWGQRLVALPDGSPAELINAVSEIRDRKNADWILEELNYQDVRIALLSLFLQLKRTPGEFIDLVNELIVWANDENERRKQLARSLPGDQQVRTGAPGRGRGRGRSGSRSPSGAAASPIPIPLPQGIADGTAAELIKLVKLSERDQRRVVRDISSAQRNLERGDQTASTLLAHLSSLKGVVDAIRSQIFSRELALPPIPEGHLYALIFIDSAIPSGEEYRGLSTEVTTRAIDFLRHIHTAKDAAVLPVLHRLGRREVIYTYADKKRPAKFRLTHEDILPPGLPSYPALLGAVMESYPVESRSSSSSPCTPCAILATGSSVRNGTPASIFRHSLPSPHNNLPAHNVLRSMPTPRRRFKTCCIKQAGRPGRLPLLPLSLHLSLLLSSFGAAFYECSLPVLR